MEKILVDLWNGNIAPCEQCGAHDPEIKDLAGLMERNREALCKGLTAKQQDAKGAVFMGSLLQEKSMAFALRIIEDNNEKVTGMIHGFFS